MLIRNMIKSLNNLPTNTFQQNEESKKENVKKQKTVTVSVKKGIYDKYISSTMTSPAS